jgi:hypothetical protein
VAAPVVAAGVVVAINAVISAILALKAKIATTSGVSSLESPARRTVVLGSIALDTQFSNVLIAWSVFSIVSI